MTLIPREGNPSGVRCRAGGLRGIWRRAVVVTVAAMLGMVGMAGQALAHNVLVSSDPAEGQQLDAGPPVVTLNFDQYVQSEAGLSQVVVTGPDGGQWTTGEVEVNGTAVSAPLRPLGPAGDYTIGYRVLSADGHPVTGKITFTLTKPGTGTPAPASAQQDAGSTDAAPAESGDSGGVPVWVWIAGAVVLLAAGVFFALRIGRE